MDYSLRPLGRVCSVSGQALAPGSSCHSALVARNGQLVRIDVADEHWTGPPEGTVGHWRAVVPAGAARPKPLDVDVLMATLEQMTEDANPANEKMRYVLALLLLQRRRLQITGNQSDEDGERLEVTGTRGEGPWTVRDFHMDDAEIEQLQAALQGQVNTQAAA